jgi:hypothetical protein
MSMAVSILIDAEGQAWPANDPALARRLGHADARLDLASFAVAQRGLIHIRSIEDGVRVTMQPGAFSRVTLAGALQALNDLAPPRILLVSRAGGGTQAELFTSVFAFIERAEQLAADPPIEIKVPRYSVQRNLRNLTTPPFAMVRPIVDLWKDRHGELGDEVFRTLATAGVARRMYLLRQPQGSSRLVTEHCAAGVTFLKPCEGLLMVGRDFHEMPDRDYGAWVADAYAVALWGGRLRLESVRSLIRTSAATTLRTRYDRVLMPWRSGNDQFVMGISIEREAPVSV